MVFGCQGIENTAKTSVLDRLYAEKRLNYGVFDGKHSKIPRASAKGRVLRKKKAAVVIHQHMYRSTSSSSHICRSTSSHICRSTSSHIYRSTSSHICRATSSHICRSTSSHILKIYILTHLQIYTITHLQIYIITHLQSYIFTCLRISSLSHCVSPSRSSFFLS